MPTLQTINIGTFDSGHGDSLAVFAQKSNYNFAALNGDSSGSYIAKSVSFAAEAFRTYLVSTASGAVTATLPASPSVGEIIQFIDASGTFATFNLIISRNGQKIMGTSSDLTVSVSYASTKLMYINSTVGWIKV